MSADLEQLDGKLAELRAQRDALAAVKTKEDRREEVESWLEAMRARYAGSARFVLGGHGSPEQVEAVLAEDKFVDAGLAGRRAEWRVGRALGLRRAPRWLCRDVVL